MNIFKNLGRLLFADDQNISPRHKVIREGVLPGQSILELKGSNFEVQVGQTPAQCWYPNIRAIIRKHSVSQSPYDFELVIVHTTESKETKLREEFEEDRKIFPLDSNIHLKRRWVPERKCTFFEWRSTTTDDVVYRFLVSNSQKDLCDLFELTALQCMYERYHRKNCSNISEEAVRKWYLVEEKNEPVPNQGIPNGLGHSKEFFSDKGNLLGEEKGNPMISLEPKEITSNAPMTSVSCKTMPNDAHSLLEIVADLFVFNPSSNEFLIFSKNVKVGLYSRPDFICKSSWVTKLANWGLLDTESSLDWLAIRSPDRVHIICNPIGPEMNPTFNDVRSPFCLFIPIRNLTFSLGTSFFHLVF